MDFNRIKRELVESEELKLKKALGAQNYYFLRVLEVSLMRNENLQERLISCREMYTPKAIQERVERGRDEFEKKYGKSK